MDHISIVTSVNAELCERFGNICLSSWVKHFPQNVEIHYYYEDARDPLSLKTHATVEILGHSFHAIPEYDSYMKSSFPADTTDYRHQAKKFSHKLFALAEAAKQSSGSSHLIWLDCDVFCFTDVPEDFFSFLFHGLSGFYLGRSQYFSECGCWGMRTDAPFYPDFLFCFLDLYISGEVYQLDQQHDSWVFDWLRNNGDEQWKNAFYNLTPTVQSGHVWLASPLADYFDHWKGKRWRIKGTPKSWFDDLHKLRQQGVDITLSHPYWFPMPLRDGKLRHLYDAEFAKESETS